LSKQARTFFTKKKKRKEKKRKAMKKAREKYKEKKGNEIFSQHIRANFGSPPPCSGAAHTPSY